MKSKEKIIDAMEQLLMEKSLDNITVNEIVKKAELSRKTFYRNFCDKYDLVNRYFDTFYQESFGTIVVGIDFEDALLRCLKIYEKKKNILKHAYESKDINGLKNYDIKITKQIYETYLQQKDIVIDSLEKDFAIEIAVRGGIEMIIQWIKGELKVDRFQLVHLIKNTLPEIIKSNV